MNKITYYYSINDQPLYQRLTAHKLYQPLIDFFLAHQEQRIILRRIKEHFSQNQELDAFLDELIEAGIIQRKNRQYQLAFPIYRDSQIQALEDQVQKDCLLLKRKIDQIKEPGLFFGEIIWPLLCEKKDSYFFGIQAEVDNIPVFYQKKKIGDNPITFVTLAKSDLKNLSLPEYFYCLENDQSVVEDNPLTKLLGDVDPNYFLHQANRVIKKIQKQRKIDLQKRNIFLESLLLTDIIVQKGESLQITQPVVETTDLPVMLKENQPIITAIQELLQQQTGSIYDTLIYGQLLFAKMVAQKKVSQLDYILIG
jgi:hypothetical protein